MVEYNSNEVRTSQKHYWTSHYGVNGEGAVDGYEPGAGLTHPAVPAFSTKPLVSPSLTAGWSPAYMPGNPIFAPTRFVHGDSVRIAFGALCPWFAQSVFHPINHRELPLTPPPSFQNTQHHSPFAQALSLKMAETIDQSSKESPRSHDSPNRSSETARPAPEEAYGFVVYRTDYTSDATWTRFMSFLNAQARSTLLSSSYRSLLDNLDWNVQQGPELHDADYDQVRE